MDTGDRLRQLREASGLSRTELARKIGVGDGAIRKIEESESSAPSFGNGLLIAKNLRCWPDEIAFTRPFPSDLTFRHEGALVEIRLRVRAGSGNPRPKIVRILRTHLAAIGEVSGNEDSERIEALEGEILDLQRRAAEALIEIERLKGC